MESSDYPENFPDGAQQQQPQYALDDPWDICAWVDDPDAKELLKKMKPDKANAVLVFKMGLMHQDNRRLVEENREVHRANKELCDTNTGLQHLFDEIKPVCETDEDFVDVSEGSLDDCESRLSGMSTEETAREFRALQGRLKHTLLEKFKWMTNADGMEMEIRDLSAKLTTAESEARGVAATVMQLQRVNGAVCDRLKAFQAKYDNTKSAMAQVAATHTELQKRTSRLENENLRLKKQQQQVKTARKARKDSHTQQKETMRAQCQSRLDKQKQLHEEAMREAEGKLTNQENLHSLAQKEWQGKLAEKEEQHAAGLEELKKQHAAGLEELKEQHRRQQQEQDDILKAQQDGAQVKIGLLETELEQLEEKTQLLEQRCEKLNGKVSLVQDDSSLFLCELQIEEKEHAKTMEKLRRARWGKVVDRLGAHTFTKKEQSDVDSVETSNPSEATEAAEATVCDSSGDRFGCQDSQGYPPHYYHEHGVYTDPQCSQFVPCTPHVYHHGSQCHPTYYYTPSSPHYQQQTSHHYPGHQAHFTPYCDPQWGLPAGGDSAHGSVQEPCKVHVPIGKEVHLVISRE